MIFGFLGKGGSGKSTLATQFTAYLLKNNSQVLAIDADHNMDLAYNLTEGRGTNVYFGSSIPDILSHCAESGPIANIFLRDTQPSFSLTPADDYTQKYAEKISETLTLMTAGPQTDTVLFGQSCSHSLTTPLKVYLPLLQLTPNEHVVVDEKAGADGVSTGIVTGIDIGIIAFEPTLHSIKTAKQIASLLEFYRTPYLFIGNKIREAEDVVFIDEQLPDTPYLTAPNTPSVQRDPSRYCDSFNSLFDDILRLAEIKNTNSRLSRTKEKFLRNREFAAAK
jgi:CO dehydrogenase maturation factor